VAVVNGPSLLMDFTTSGPLGRCARSRRAGPEEAEPGGQRAALTELISRFGSIARPRCVFAGGSAG
jgi:hypothetical protein